MLLFLVLIGCCVILALTLRDSFRWGITPTSTSAKVREALWCLIPSQSGGLIVDLGSGFGGLAYHLKKKYPDTRVMGLEGAFLPFCLSKCLYPHFKSFVEYRRCDFLKENLNEASLVVCYLYPKISPKLKEKFLKELKPGTFVLSHTFAIEGLTLVKSIQAKDLYQTPVYLYQI